MKFLGLCSELGRGRFWWSGLLGLVADGVMRQW